MKSLIITIATMFLFLITVINSNATGVVKETDSFIINTNDNFEAGNHALKSWTIVYGDQGKKIEVFKDVTKKGEEYIVRNDFFEVRYTNGTNGFGVRKIRNKQMKIDVTINNAVINTDQMQKQSILSPEQLTEDKALNYIASYVPFLLNSNYTHLLN